MNQLDAAIAIMTLVAVVMGFNYGLLRSLATIFGYIAALPATIALAPFLPLAAGRLTIAQPQSMLVLFGIFFVIGLVLSALLRLAVSEAVGPTISLPDRAAGAALGAVRVGLLAVLLVLFGIFFVIGLVLSALLRLAVSEAVGPTISLPDRAAGAALGAVRVGLLAVLLVLIFRMIPPKLEPAFLKESRLRPMLSVAGQSGLKTLPPEAALYIDRLRKERGI